MKSLTNLRELEAFGLQMLTGESCALSMRLLLDVNDKGRELLCHFFGLPEMSLSAPWNSGDIGNTGARIGSITLTHESCWELLIFAYAIREFTVVRCKSQIVVLDFEDEEWFKDMEKREVVLPDIIRTYLMRGPQRNGRNIHQMSGRSM